MSDNRFSIEALDKSHNKQLFCCGVSSLDNYLHKQASQDLRRHISITYILQNIAVSQVAGYYTLSSASIQLSSLPEEASKKLPSYPLLPGTLIGRLAIDQNYQKQGLGEILLIDALKTIFKASQQVASYAVIVDAIDDNASMFYKKYGFIPLSTSEKKLYLPMATVSKIV